MAHTFPLEAHYTIYKSNMEGKAQESIPKAFSSREDAIEWLKENATPKQHYIIVETFRRQ